MTNGID